MIQSTVYKPKIDYERQNALEWQVRANKEDISNNSDDEYSSEDDVPISGTHPSYQQQVPVYAPTTLPNKPAWSQFAERAQGINSSQVARPRNTGALRATAPSGVRLQYKKDSRAEARWRNRAPHDGVFELPVSYLTLTASRFSSQTVTTELPPNPFQPLIDIATRTRTFIRSPGANDKILYIWALRPTDLDAAKRELDLWSRPLRPAEATPRRGINRDRGTMSATRVITAREKSKIERQIEEASQKQEYRREPEDMDQFCVTGTFLWPRDAVKPEKLFGIQYAALDPLRMFYECYIIYGGEHQAFKVLTNDNDLKIGRLRVTAALKQLKIVLCECMTRTSNPLEIYLAAPLDSASVKSEVKLIAAHERIQRTTGTVSIEKSRRVPLSHDIEIKKGDNNINSNREAQRKENQQPLTSATRKPSAFPNQSLGKGKGNAINGGIPSNPQHAIYQPVQSNIKTKNTLSFPKIDANESSLTVPFLTGNTLTELEAADWDVEAEVNARTDVVTMENAAREVLSHMIYFRGRIQLRTNIGQYFFIRNRIKVLESSMPTKDFVEKIIMKANSATGQLSKLINTPSTEAELIPQLQQANHILVPLENTTTNLKDVRPMYIAYFGFPYRDTVEFKLLVEATSVVRAIGRVGKTVKDITCEILSKQWTRQDNATHTPLQLCMMPLKRGLSWKMALNAGYNIDYSKIRPEHHEFCDKVTVMQPSGLVDNEGGTELMFNFPAMKDMTFSQKTAWRYRMKANHKYTFEMARYDFFDVKRDISTVGNRVPRQSKWGASVWREDWDELFSQNASLRIGEHATWDPALNAFFPKSIGTRSDDADIGFSQYLDMVQSIVDLLSPTLAT